jgi:hypothetical protein
MECLGETILSSLKHIITVNTEDSSHVAEADQARASDVIDELRVAMDALYSSKNTQEKDATE